MYWQNAGIDRLCPSSSLALFHHVLKYIDTRITGPIVKLHTHPRDRHHAERPLPPNASSLTTSVLAGEGTCVLDILRTTDSSRIAICSHGNAIALLLNALDPSFLFAQRWNARGTRGCAIRRASAFQTRWYRCGLPIAGPGRSACPDRNKGCTVPQGAR